LASHGDPWWQLLPFLGLTLLFLALPVLIVLAFGQEDVPTAVEVRWRSRC
jgi:hypothetical protein